MRGICIKKFFGTVLRIITLVKLLRLAMIRSVIVCAMAELCSALRLGNDTILSAL